MNMKMKMKALAAAVAMAVSGGAFAATANTNTSGGNSELIMNVWDSVAQASFSMDLSALASAPQMGSFYLNDFLPVGVAPGGLLNNAAGSAYTQAPGTVEALGTSFNWSMGGSAWTNFQNVVAQQGSNSSNWQWGIIGGDSTGGTGKLDQVRYLVTSKAPESVFDTQMNHSQLGNMISIDALMDGISLDNLAVADNSISAVVGDGLYFGNTGERIYTALPASAMAGLNESMSFFYMSGTSTTVRGNGFDAKTFANGAHWAFDGSTLTYATNAVPVPAAVWLLGSALVGLVGVARRRSAA